MQIEEALERYRLQLTADGRSDHTVRQVTRHVRLFAGWHAQGRGVCAVEEVRHEDVASFLASDLGRLRADGRPRKPTTANAQRTSLRVFFGYLHAAGYARLNAAALVRRARCGVGPPRALSDADRNRLVAELAKAKTPAEVRDRVLFLTLLTAGPRVGSALAADVGDLDLAAGELRLRTMKGSGEDLVFLPRETVELLRTFVGDRRAGPLFTGRGGLRLGHRQAHRRLALCARRAGIQGAVHPHRLRHSFGQHLYRTTRDLIIVARGMCHRSVTSSAIYARADSATVRHAVEAGYPTV